jgi:hypothetical protein
MVGVYETILCSKVKAIPAIAESQIFDATAGWEGAVTS